MTAVPDQLQAKRQLAVALMAKAKQTDRSAPARNKTRPSSSASLTGLLTWTRVLRQEIAPGKPFSLHDHLYLKDMYAEIAREIIYMKAGQIGISELLISYALHAMAVRGADVMYLMPTDTDVSDFSQSRFGPALEASAQISSLLRPAGREIRGADKVTLKRIANNFLYLRGGHVKKDGQARQLKSVPVDILIGDEIDEMDKRAMPIARKRLGHSPLKEVRQASTPTYHGRGIHLEWEKSDQREWFVRCSHCGRRQMMTIKHVVTEWDDLERPMAWHGMKDGRAFVACEKCGKELNRVGVGEWVPAFPGRAIVGYHPTKLMAVHTSLLEVVNNFLTVDETKRKEAYNQDLGLPYTPRGGRLDDTILDALKRDYGHGPVPGLRTYAGIDVGKVLHIIIRAKMDEKGERRQLWAGDVVSFDDAARILKQYKVSICVIDALPETRKARELQAGFRDGVVWLAYFSGAEKDVDGVVWNKKEGIVNLDRTRTMDAMYAGFYDGETNVVPAHIASVEDYYDHLKAPVRVIEKRGGKETAVYIEDGPDHFALAETYCLAASMNTLGQANSEAHGVDVSHYFD